MKLEIKIPSVGESVTQGIISSWLKAEGDFVEEGGDLLELETDKANVTVPAPAAGVVSITVKPGTEVTIGQVVGYIDSAASKPAAQPPAPQPTPAPARTAPASAQPAAMPAAPQPPAPARAAAPPVLAVATPPAPTAAPSAAVTSAPAPAAPPARAAAPEPARPPAPAQRPPASSGNGATPPTRTPMSSLRKRIAQRLLEAQHSTASLSTFNEVNMKNVMDLRSRYREEFERIHGVRLGFMSFFVKAVCRALAEFPMVNARIDGDEIVYYNTFDIGVAVSTDRGLVVPVVKGADRLEHRAAGGRRCGPCLTRARQKDTS